MYVEHVELYSCEDISDQESDSVSRELTSLIHPCEYWLFKHSEGIPMLRRDRSIAMQ